jgi:osmotically-inducible protein OsmY
MNDKRLRQLVAEELDFEPSVDAAHIGVAVEQGIVTLSGHAGSYAEKMAAEQAVRRVKGVRGIAEGIEVRYAADKKEADDQIVQRALAIIGWDTQIPKDAVTVMVQKGWVTLAGTVDWNFQRVAAEAAVRKLSGVIGVTNQISVKPHVEMADVKKRITEALKRSASVEAEGIRIEVEGGKVRLEGKIKAGYERDLAAHAAWSVPGVRTVEDHLVVS